MHCLPYEILLDLYGSNDIESYDRTDISCNVCTDITCYVYGNKNWSIGVHGGYFVVIDYSLSFLWR